MTKTTKEITKKKAIAVLLGVILFTAMTAAMPIVTLWMYLQSKLRGAIIILSLDTIVILLVAIVMTAIFGALWGKLLREEVDTIVFVFKKTLKLFNEQREEKC